MKETKEQDFYIKRNEYCVVESGSNGAKELKDLIIEILRKQINQLEL